VLVGAEFHIEECPALVCIDATQVDHVGQVVRDASLKLGARRVDQGGDRFDLEARFDELPFRFEGVAADAGVLNKQQLLGIRKSAVFTIVTSDAPPEPRSISRGVTVTNASTADSRGAISSASRSADLKAIAYLNDNDISAAQVGYLRITDPLSRA